MTLTIDTTGIGGGVFALEMIGNNNDDGIALNVGPSTFLFGNGGGISTIIDGTIVVPEPSSVVLSLLGIAGFGVVAIRKRRARRM